MLNATKPEEVSSGPKIMNQSKAEQPGAEEQQSGAMVDYE